MKSLKAIFAIACIISSNLVFGQEPSFYDLNFSMDSTSTPYKSSGSNYVFIRSKRGTEPVKSTSSGDSIKSFAIQQIVLVFSESSTSEIENRESYNQERWENLMPTYPEFFQTNTTYKNICQCSQDAASPSYKEVQGFYIYYTPKPGSQPKKEVEVAKTEIAKPAETQKDIVKEEPKKVAEVVKTETPKVIEPKKEIAKEETKKVVEVAKKEEPKKQETSMMDKAGNFFTGKLDLSALPKEDQAAIKDLQDAGFKLKEVKGEKGVYEVDMNGLGDKSKFDLAKKQFTTDALKSGGNDFTTKFSDSKDATDKMTKENRIINTNLELKNIPELSWQTDLNKQEPQYQKLTAQKATLEKDLGIAAPAPAAAWAEWGK